MIQSTEPPAKKVRKVRRLSSFFCGELLYDYASGALDEERLLAVEEYLSENPDQQKNLEQIKSALAYCQRLSATTISEELRASVIKDKNLLLQTKEVLSWKNWPDSVKWSVEALLVSVVIASVVIFVPWSKLRTLIMPDKTPVPVIVESDNVQKMRKHTEPIENEEEATSQVADRQQETTSNEVEKEDIGEDLVSSTSTEAEVVEPASQNQALKGELYRLFMSHISVDQITPEIVAKIEMLGGKKAGKVKLGWRKVDGSYFHFTIQESNYEELVNFLRTFGEVHVTRDLHWRIMPEGKKRLILWLEDGSKGK